MAARLPLAPPGGEMCYFLVLFLVCLCSPTAIRQEVEELVPV